MKLMSLRGSHPGITKKIIFAARHHEMEARKADIEKAPLTSGFDRLRLKMINHVVKLNTISIGFIASIGGDLISMAVLSNQLDQDDQLTTDQKNELRFQKFASCIGDFLIYWPLVKIASASGLIQRLARYLTQGHSQAALAQKVIADLIAILPIGIVVNEVLKTKFVVMFTSFLVSHQAHLPVWLSWLTRTLKTQGTPASPSALWPITNKLPQQNQLDDYQKRSPQLIG